MTSQYRSEPTSICYCCGRPGASTPVDSGPMHFRCWDEHHSDPTGEWPRGHACVLDEVSS